MNILHLFVDEITILLWFPLPSLINVVGYIPAVSSFLFLVKSVCSMVNIPLISFNQ